MKTTYKRLDVRAIYTDDNSIYLKLVSGNFLRIRRINNHYSTALTECKFEPTGDVHKITPDEVLRHLSIAF